MTNSQIIEHLNKVHTENTDWESEGNTFYYAHDLWQAAQECMQQPNTNDIKIIAKEVYDILHTTGSLAKCLTDNFRKLIIRHHARGIPTIDTINMILPDETLKDETPFYVLKFANVCGYDNIKKFLLQRISNLKPTDPRWPHKKYGQYWKSEREEYLNTINDIPFTNVTEQISKLSEHYTALESHFNATNDPVDIERLHRCKLQTISAIHILTRNTDINIQHTIFQRNKTNIILDAISDTPLQTGPLKQLANNVQEQNRAKNSATVKKRKKAI